MPVGDRQAMSRPPQLSSLDFLEGGGEAGALIRAYDWTSTPLGRPETWPQPLRTAVRLLLSTRHPMLLLWGHELIQFYNDAFSASLGPERHPAAIGQRGRDCWAETWPVVGPQIEQVMSGGESTWHENQLVPITRNGQVDEVYWTYSFSPIDDETAPHGVGGVLVVCTETTQAVLASRRSGAEAENWRHIFEQSPSFMSILRGPDYVHEYVNAAHRRIFNSADWIGRPLDEAFPDIVDQGFIELLDQVYETGEHLVFAATPVRFRRTPDASEQTRYLDFIFQPLKDDQGTVTGIVCEGFDVTDAIAAVRSLRESEQRLRLATEAAEVGLWDLDVATGVIVCPPRVKAMFGLAPNAVISRSDLRIGIHPDDRQRVSAALAAALDPNKRALFDCEYRAIGRDGAMRWLAVKGRGIFNSDGVCERMIGVALDVTSRKTAETHLRLMVNELNHRVKNSLAIVQAIAAQTLRSENVPDHVRESLTDRLMALSKAHDVLTDEKWSGAGLHELAQQAATPYGADDGERFVVSGPPVNLPPKTAIAVALAFHELATNAAKYGALSVPDGQVRVSWRTSRPKGEPRRLHLTWQEVGGPPVVEPQNTGFGARLITRGLAAELQGEVKLTFPPTGVVCTIDAPINGEGA